MNKKKPLAIGYQPRSYCGAIVAITLIAFLPTFWNGYVQWDDPQYILHNPLFSAPFKVIFSSFYMWNYHPLTILVYSIEHKFFGSDMFGYHAVSLLLHIANSVLVFYFIYYLLSKTNVMIPFITALLFGIHPMHVESVAWASELKDVLYTFFFLSSLICYVLYVQKGKQIKYLLYAFGLFLLSLISKGQAVTLPLCFLLVDYFLKRDKGLGVRGKVSLIPYSLTLIPFFLLSLVFGIVALKAQDTAISINNNSQILQNFCFGFYGLCLYLLKFILPINLSGLYPYPLNPDRSMPVIVYIAPLIIAVLLFLVFSEWIPLGKMFRKNKFVIFGVLFFLANIFTVLKFIPVSEAIIADRYSYIPYIGLFFVVGYGLNELQVKLLPPKLQNTKLHQKNPGDFWRLGVLVAMALLLLFTFSFLTFKRTMVWKDSFSFWGDAIEKAPAYWHPYECIGEAYIEKKDYDSAIKYFQESVEKDIHHLDSKNSGRLNLALSYSNRGSIELYQSGNYNAAIADYNNALQLNPDNIDAIINKGTAYYKEGNFDEALNNYKIGLAKANGNATIYYYMALAYAGKKDYTNALQYAEQAQKMGLNIDAGQLQEWRGKL